MKPKKRPQRLCTGCKEMKDKTELVRVVRSAEDAVSLDLTGRAPGRGAYICKNRDCLSLAMRSRGLERSLHTKVSEQVYLEMEEQLDTNE